jgi:lipopolysaccharide/colanic/teichoic acid biosynthesis glycosyltransferase
MSERFLVLMKNSDPFYPFLKRVLDLVVSITAIFVLSPLLLTIAFLVRFNLGKPILFSQERPGLRGTPFTMIKFRTMRHETNAEGILLDDSQRLTKFGKLLRSTSLDELPELWNILKGDMSLVGPRPLLMQYLPLYSPLQARRHEVKPGITGWAQINGRNMLSWKEKFDLDIWYVNNRNIYLDLKIISKTFWKVISRSDISSDQHATMPPFEGNGE